MQPYRFRPAPREAPRAEPVPAGRKRFRHEGEAARRAALIAAVIDCMAEGGVEAATVRAIARRADVTQGLIRHYFPSKDDLIAAAYEQLIEQLFEAPDRALAEAPDDAGQRLGAFVRGALEADAVDDKLLSAWAGYVGALRRAPGLRAIHAASYERFRCKLEGLIRAALADAGRSVDAAALRGQAIAVTALLDGLWLEGGLLPDGFEPGELARLGLAATGAILDLKFAEEMIP